LTESLELVRNQLVARINLAMKRRIVNTGGKLNSTASVKNCALEVFKAMFPQATLYNNVYELVINDAMTAYELLGVAPKLKGSCLIWLSPRFYVPEEDGTGSYYASVRKIDENQYEGFKGWQDFDSIRGAAHTFQVGGGVEVSCERAERVFFNPDALPNLGNDEFPIVVQQYFTQGTRKGVIAVEFTTSYVETGTKILYQ
jgi:hypothetical protein